LFLLQNFVAKQFKRWIIIFKFSNFRIPIPRNPKYHLLLIFEQDCEGSFVTINLFFVLTNTLLTPRENEILLLVIKEFTSVEIAKELQLSVRTVETHRKNITRKTSSQNLIGLIKYAIRAGLVEGFHFSKSRS
jgi:DNA-binding CsgD family transcriptional regulator